MMRDPQKINRLLELVFPNHQCYATNFSMEMHHQPVQILGNFNPAPYVSGSVSYRIRFSIRITRAEIVHSRHFDLHSISVSELFNRHLGGYSVTFEDHMHNALMLEGELMVPDDDFFDRVEKDVHNYYDRIANVAIDEMLTSE